MARIENVDLCKAKTGWCNCPLAQADIRLGVGPAYYSYDGRRSHHEEAFMIAWDRLPNTTHGLRPNDLHDWANRIEKARF